MKLRELAILMRCQVPREKAQESEMREYSGEDWNCEGYARFVGPNAGTPVHAKLGPRSLKFPLQLNDIIIGSGGTKNTIAMAAFVAFKPECQIITNKNLIVIRPDSKLIDPVWLYYRLAQTDIREKLAENASGGSSRYLSTDAIGELEIRMPAKTELKSVHDIHKSFLESFWANSTRLEKEKQEWDKLIKIMKY